MGGSALSAHPLIQTMIRDTENAFLSQKTDPALKKLHYTCRVPGCKRLSDFNREKMLNHLKKSHKEVWEILEEDLRVGLSEVQETLNAMSKVDPHGVGRDDEYRNIPQAIETLMSVENTVSEANLQKDSQEELLKRAGDFVQMVSERMLESLQEFLSLNEKKEATREKYASVFLKNCDELMIALNTCRDDIMSEHSAHRLKTVCIVLFNVLRYTNLCVSELEENEFEIPDDFKKAKYDHSNLQ